MPGQATVPQVVIDLTSAEPNNATKVASEAQPSLVDGQTVPSNQG